MSSYFNLALDTTGPEIEVNISPQSIKPGGYLLINIIGDEIFDPDHYLAYLTDSRGVRHDLELDIEDNEANSVVHITNYPLGLLILTVVMKDLVWNSSSIITKILYIEVKERVLCIIDIGSGQGDIEVINNRSLLSILDTERILEVIRYRTNIGIQKKKDGNTPVTELTIL